VNHNGNLSSSKEQGRAPGPVEERGEVGQAKAKDNREWCASQSFFVVFKASAENTHVLSIICAQAAEVQNTTGTIKCTRKA
jgi:hypothetical protein